MNHLVKTSLIVSIILLFADSILGQTQEKVLIHNRSNNSNAITVKVNNIRYEILPQQGIVLSGISIYGESISVWNCLNSGCHWIQHTIYGKRKYDLIDSEISGKNLFKDKGPLILKVAKEECTNEDMRMETLAWQNDEYEKVLNTVFKCAENGSMASQFRLGYMHRKGLGGLSQDNEMAFEWYQKSAENGYAYAQNNLGFMYENGLGTDKNLSQARFWYEKACNNSTSNNGCNNLKQLLENKNSSSDLSNARPDKTRASQRKEKFIGRILVNGQHFNYNRLHASFSGGSLGIEFIRDCQDQKICELFQVHLHMPKPFKPSLEDYVGKYASQKSDLKGLYCENKPCRPYESHFLGGQEIAEQCYFSLNLKSVNDKILDLDFKFKGANRDEEFVIVEGESIRIELAARDR